MPTARAAQGLGLLLFFGTFFVVGGGPPPGVLPDWLSSGAGFTPTGMLIHAIRSPWVGDGNHIAAFLALATMAVLGSAFAIRRLARS